MKRNIAISLISSILTFVAFLLVGSQAFAATQGGRQTAVQAFEKLKELAGRWQATTAKGKVSTTFELTSGGSAVLERMEMPGEQQMITVYYLDGNRLLLTHYCEMGNQPRMQATSFDPQSNAIDFRFLDATNLASPNAGHMHDAVITFRGPNEVSEDWTFWANGKPSFTVPLVYHRAN